MAIMIGINSEKGGVGKTSISLHLAVYLNKKGFTTLLIDNDSQLDLSKNLNNEAYIGKSSGLLELLQGSVNLEDILYEKYNERFLFLLGSRNLNHYEAPANYRAYDEILKSEWLAGVDYIIVDNPPAVNDAVLQSLVVSDYTIMVTDLEEYSLRNLQQMVEDLKVVKDESNPNIELLGVIANKLDRRRNLSRKNLTDLQNVMGNLMFDTVISVCSAIPLAQSIGETVAHINWSPAAMQFNALADEVVKRTEGRIQ